MRIGSSGSHWVALELTSLLRSSTNCGSEVQHQRCSAGLGVTLMSVFRVSKSVFNWMMMMIHFTFTNDFHPEFVATGFQYPLAFPAIRPSAGVVRPKKSVDGTIGLRLRKGAGYEMKPGGYLMVIFSLNKIHGFPRSFSQSKVGWQGCRGKCASLRTALGHHWTSRSRCGCPGNGFSLLLGGQVMLSLLSLSRTLRSHRITDIQSTSVGLCWVHFVERSSKLRRQWMSMTSGAFLRHVLPGCFSLASDHRPYGGAFVANMTAIISDGEIIQQSWFMVTN